MNQKVRIFKGTSASIESDILDYMKTGYKIHCLSSAFFNGDTLVVVVVFEKLKPKIRPRTMY